MNSIQDDLLSVMIRCDADDLAALDRGLFHLFSQQYRPIEIVVVISASLGPDFLAGVKDLYARWAPSFFHFEVLQELEGELLDLEHVIQRCHGRYLTILNLMNKVYPQFYQTAISSLQNHLQYGWANCDVVMTHYSSDGKIEKRWAPFLRTKYSFLDNLKFDFVPIDSVIIDRLRVPEIDQFQDYFFSHDDHTLLLKIACLYQPIYLSFIGIDISVVRNEQIPNVDFADEVVKRFSKFDQKKLPGLWWGNQIIINKAWEAEFNNSSFRTSLLRYDRQFHPESYRYRNMLEECYKSPSWRLTKYFRHLINYLKGLPSPDDKTPETEELAITQLLLLYQSTSWLISWPIRKMLNKSINR
jgi:hypothetical protein